MFLPSFLEYSKSQLKQKLDFLSKNQNLAKNILNVEDIVPHLDVISCDFAKNIGVRPSVSYQDMLDIFQENKLFNFLTIHLMFTLQELKRDKKQIISELKKHQIKGIIYIPEEVFMEFQMLLDAECSFSFGLWYDLGCWPKKMHKVEDCLLMTVKAGLSGQKMLAKDKNKVLKLVEENPQVSFLLDGGWSLQDQSQLKNVNIVSYSSFWQELEEKSKI